jgi:hypothetical protein
MREFEVRSGEASLRYEEGGEEVLGDRDTCFQAIIKQCSG